ncbi:hypothetical protein KIL84_017567 [Mauremys mutica]|uniref:Coiled-coil domain-containing protein 167 n=1 Tax=Mauremys mutica TaxID=74926 RepID=A0A9D4AWZ9_9SAUR|nr:hypothetical protein KIL84_017567 [Mauremys mutica]
MVMVSLLASNSPTVQGLWYHGNQGAGAEEFVTSAVCLQGTGKDGVSSCSCWRFEDEKCLILAVTKVGLNLVSWLHKIDGLEEKLSLCRQSMEEVDLKLLREELSPEGRKSLERERSLLVTKAETYERELKVLRQENRKNAAIAMAIVLLIIVVYTCWTM